MGILDGIVEWIAEQVMAGLDLVTTSVLGALGCDMAVFLRYFPAAETMYSVFVALAIGIILLNWVWQLFKNFGLGAGVEAEDPVKLSIRSVIFILLTLFSDEIVNIVLTIGGTPYHWIMESDLPALSFADFNSVMLVIIGVCANGAVALITLILVLILAWNYLKLLFEAAERYVLLGVLVYTAPVAFSMGASQTTANIWKSWCRMLGGQIFLLVMNAWCLRLFTSMVGSLRTRFRCKEVLSLKKLKKILFAAFTVAILSCLFCQPAFAAISESDVQAQVDAVGKEAVSGNVFIWFLCAIGFLKVSQKIDSFMASLGINVGRTGGSMLTELMVAGRGIAAVAGAVGGTVFNHHSSSNSTHTNAQAAGAAFTGGGNGLVGVTRRAAGNAAAASATGNAKGLSNLVGGAMFESSLQNGGKFAMSVVGAVAKGSISSVGFITGDQAAEALTSYLGYSPVDSGSALADDGGLIPPSPITSEDVVTLDGGTAAGTASPTASANGTPIPSGAREHDGSVVESARISGAPPIFQNVEIGGGRITGLEVSPDRQSDREFAMYSTEQYMAPTGPYDTVQTVDGASWYRQYAQPKVEKTPYTDEGDKIRYEERIVSQMPPVPKRKDKI